MPEVSPKSVEQVQTSFEEKVLKEKVVSSCKVSGGDNLSKVFEKLGLDRSHVVLTTQVTNPFKIMHAGDIFSHVKRTVSTGVTTQDQEVIMSKGKEYILSRTDLEYKIPEDSFVNVGEKKITTARGLLNRLHESYPSLVKDNVYNYGKDIISNIPGDFKEGDMAWCVKEGGSTVLYYLPKGEKVPKTLLLEGRTLSKK